MNECLVATIPEIGLRLRGPFSHKGWRQVMVGAKSRGPSQYR
jgi:hypothetical protein